MSAEKKIERTKKIAFNLSKSADDKTPLFFRNVENKNNNNEFKIERRISMLSSLTLVRFDLHLCFIFDSFFSRVASPSFQGMRTL